jgi:hypothetical protein
MEGTVVVGGMVVIVDQATEKKPGGWMSTRFGSVPCKPKCRSDLRLRRELHVLVLI